MKKNDDTFYRKVERSIWNYRQFTGLPEDETRLVYLFLRTWPDSTPVPGLIVASPVRIADGLRLRDHPSHGRADERVARHLSAMVDAGLIFWSEEARVIFVGSEPWMNPLATAKAAAYARSEFEMTPDCDAKEVARATLERVLESQPAEIRRAWHGVTQLATEPTATESDAATVGDAASAGVWSGIIENIESRRVAHGPNVVRVEYIICGADGTKFGTFSTAVANAADDARQSGEEVQIVYDDGLRGRKELRSLKSEDGRLWPAGPEVQ